MKFCRFLPLDTSVARPATPLYGLLEDGQVCELSGAPWGKWSRTAHTWPLADVRLAAPVAPGKIVCVGRNYAAHAAELGNDVPKEPMIFLKPSSSIIGPGEPIVLPIYSQRVEHEAELAVVIGRRCSHLTRLGRCSGKCSRLHLRQRRYRARLAEDGCAVHAGQRLRHLLSRWAAHRNRSRSYERSRRSPRQRRAAPVGQHFADVVSVRISRSVDFPDDDAVSGRRDFHGHSFRCRPAGRERRRGGVGGGNRTCCVIRCMPRKRSARLPSVFGRIRIREGFSA